MQSAMGRLERRFYGLPLNVCKSESPAFFHGSHLLGIRHFAYKESKN
jgi:hypothetical protein